MVTPQKTRGVESPRKRGAPALVRRIVTRPGSLTVSGRGPGRFTTQITTAKSLST